VQERKGRCDGGGCPLSSELPKNRLQITGQGEVKQQQDEGEKRNVAWAERSSDGKLHRPSYENMFILFMYI